MIRKYFLEIMVMLVVTLALLFYGYSYFYGNPLTLRDVKKSADLFVKTSGIKGLKSGPIVYDKGGNSYKITVIHDEDKDYNSDFIIKEGKILVDEASKDYFTGVRNINIVNRLLKEIGDKANPGLKEYAKEKGYEIKSVEFTSGFSKEEIKKDKEVEAFSSSIYNKKDFQKWLTRSSLNIVYLASEATWDDIYFACKNASESFKEDIKPALINISIVDGEGNTLIGVDKLPIEVIDGEDFSSQIDTYLFSKSKE